MKYGYIRVSRPQQNPERQRENITRTAPDARIYEEKYTGTTMQRPAWQRLTKAARSGDTIIFDSVSRMARTASEGFAAYEELYARGIELVFLKEPAINTSAYRESAQEIAPQGDEAINAIIEGVNKALAILRRRQFLAAFEQAEKEVTDLHARTREGMHAAGATNIKDAAGNIIERGSISRARTGKTYHTQQEARALAVIKEHARAFGGSLTDAECIKLAGVARATYYKYKDQLAAQAGK